MPREEQHAHDTHTPVQCAVDYNTGTAITHHYTVKCLHIGVQSAHLCRRDKPQLEDHRDNLHHCRADLSFVVEVATEHLIGIRLRNAAVDTGEVEGRKMYLIKVFSECACAAVCSAETHRDSWSPISARVSESLSEASAAGAKQSIATTTTTATQPRLGWLQGCHSDLGTVSCTCSSFQHTQVHTFFVSVFLLPSHFILTKMVKEVPQKLHLLFHRGLVPQPS